MHSTNSNGTPHEDGERFSKWNSLAVVGSRDLGDLLILMPHLEALHERHPDRRILLLTNRFGLQLYSNLDGVEVYDRDDAAARRAVFGECDLVVVPYCEHHGWRSLAEAHVPLVAFEGDCPHPEIEASRWVAPRVDHPETANLQNLFSIFSPMHRALPRRPRFTERETREGRAALDRLALESGTFVAISPGSSRVAKQWRPDRWAEIVRRLRRDRQLPVLLMGSPAERPLCDEIAQASGEQCAVYCDRSIRGALWLLGEAMLVAGVDSAAKHMASAMGTASICLFGPTNERRWGGQGLGGPHIVVRAAPRPEPQPPLVDGAPHPTMDAIAVDDVWEALGRVLRQPLTAPI